MHASRKDSSLKLSIDCVFIKVLLMLKLLSLDKKFLQFRSSFTVAKLVRAGLNQVPAQNISENNIIIILMPTHHKIICSCFDFLLENSG